jgi:hypothetical protein
VATTTIFTTTLGANTIRSLYIETLFYEDITVRVTEKKQQANRIARWEMRLDRQITQTLKTLAHLQRRRKSKSADEKKKAPPKNDETNPNPQ